MLLWRISNILFNILFSQRNDVEPSQANISKGIFDLSCDIQAMNENIMVSQHTMLYEIVLQTNFYSQYFICEGK